MELYFHDHAFVPLFIQVKGLYIDPRRRLNLSLLGKLS